MKKIIFYAFTMNILSLLLLSFYVANASDAFSVSLETPYKRPTGKIVLDKLSKIYEPVQFDHGLHDKITDQCALCHHIHGTYEPLKCDECHTLTADSFKKSVGKGFLPCQGCHKTYDPAHPEFPGLQAAYHQKCFQCHRGMENEGVDAKLLASVKQKYKEKNIEKVGADPKGCVKTCHKLRERIASWR